MDGCHVAWLKVTSNRFERFTGFKPPAPPEVHDFQFLESAPAILRLIILTALTLRHITAV